MKHTLLCLREFMGNVASMLFMLVPISALGAFACWFVLCVLGGSTTPFTLFWKMVYLSGVTVGLIHGGIVDFRRWRLERGWATIWSTDAETVFMALRVYKINKDHPQWREWTPDEFANRYQAYVIAHRLVAGVVVRTMKDNPSP